MTYPIFIALTSITAPIDIGILEAITVVITSIRLVEGKRVDKISDILIPLINNPIAPDIIEANKADKNSIAYCPWVELYS